MQRKFEHHYLIVLVGLSGSGKSKFSRQILKGFSRISLDSVRRELTGDRANQNQNDTVVHIAFERLKVKMANGENCVWDATSLLPEYRNTLIELGETYRATIVCIEFEIPFDVLLARDKVRKNPVGIDVLKRQAHNYSKVKIGEFNDHIVLNEAKRAIRSSGALAAHLIEEFSLK